MEQQNTRMGEKKVTVRNDETTVHIMTQRADLAARQREQTLKEEIISHVKVDQ